MVLDLLHLVNTEKLTITLLALVYRRHKETHVFRNFVSSIKLPVRKNETMTQEYQR